MLTFCPKRGVHYSVKRLSNPAMVNWLVLIYAFFDARYFFAFGIFLCINDIQIWEILLNHKHLRLNQQTLFNWQFHITLGRLPHVRAIAGNIFDFRFHV